MTAFSAAAHDEGGDTIKALRARITELEDMLANLPLSSPQRLRARIQRLEEMLAAVGAGGVGPLIPATVQHQHESSSDNELQRKTGDLIATAAPPQSGGITPNWKLVPVEPTEAMHQAAVRAIMHCTGNDDFPPAVYRGMLDAAPQPPVVEQPQIDWHDMYIKERRRTEMWIAKYEQDIGRLERAVPAAQQQQGEQDPVFWYRSVGSDGGYEGPIHNSAIERVRRLSGAWVPLVPRQQPPDPAYLLRDLADDISVDALDLIAAIRDAGLGSYSINMMLQAKVCVAMCQRFSAVEQAPVAWRLRNTAFRSEVYEYFKTKFQAESRQMQFNMSCDDGGLHGLTPLYTRPQPQRKPLTNEQIKKMLDNCDDGQKEAEVALAFARAIERAHGIEGQA